MIGVLEELRESMADPSMRHAAMVHVPVAMATLGVIVAFVAAISRRTRTARVVAVIWFVGLAGSAFLATQSGEDAERALAVTLPAAAFERVAAHAEMAERVWLFAAGVAALFAISLVPDRLVRAIASVLGLGVAIGTAGWTGLAAHHGGVLVYEFGAGTALSRVTAPAAVDRPTEGDAGGGTALAPEAPDGDQAPRTAGEGAATLVDASSTDPRMVFFDDSVLPLLAAHCQACHNSVRPKAKLDLTSAAGLLAGGRSGLPTVTPGRPEESLLLAVVRGEHPDIDPMPPDEELSAEEIAMLERWIREGAVWGRAE